MKHKIIALLCSVAILFSSAPVYAADPFKGWNEENKENVWAIMETTDWSKMQDFLTLDTINNTVSADVSSTVRGYEAEVRRVINSTDIAISDGLVELMLALMQVMGGNNPPTDDPYKVKEWIDPSASNMTAEKSIRKVLYKLDSARRVHPEPDKVSYFVNSDELRSVVQGVILGTRYTQENAKYSLDSANAYYQTHKVEFDQKGITPILTLGNDVAAIYKTTNTSGGIGSAEGKAVVEYAMQFIGNPYVYGGNSLTNGIDCSGFTQQVYAHFGYSLPRTTFEQINCGVGITFEESQAGDLIFNHNVGHVMILTGDGGAVHASNSAPYPKGGIKYTQNALYSGYDAIRRIIQ